MKNKKGNYEDLEMSTFIKSMESYDTDNLKKETKTI